MVFMNSDCILSDFVREAVTLPACGNRSFYSRQGTFGNAGTNGNCQSSAASASNWDWSCYFNLNTTTVNAAKSDNWPSNAISVRCVKEK